MTKIYRHISELLTLSSAEKKDGRKLLPEDLSIIKNAAIVCDNSKIVWVGPDANLDEKYKKLSSVETTIILYNLPIEYNNNGIPINLSQSSLKLDVSSIDIINAERKIKEILLEKTGLDFDKYLVDLE